MFATASLAARIERAESSLVSAAATAAASRVPSLIHRPMAGGFAVFVEPDSPYNKVVGLGFDGVPSDGELDDTEAAFAARGGDVRVEVASLGDPELTRILTRRGYELIGFENVLGLALTTSAWRAVSTGGVVTVERGEADGDAWLDTVTTGFLHPDTFDGPPATESYPREALERVFGDTLRASGFERYIAKREGAIAGGAGMRLSDGIAQLCGAATLPEHRRRGVQSALLRARLASAAARGSDLAVVTTQPGSKSQENVQRLGFALLYARAVLVKAAQS